jgi:transposase-like protein
MSAETLRNWLGQAEVDAGEAPGVPTKIRELRRRNAELERAEILRQPRVHSRERAAATPLICYGGSSS